MDNSNTSILDAMNPLNHKLNWLLIFVPIAILTEFTDVAGSNKEMVLFTSTLLAILPLAGLLGKSTEQISLRTSEKLGGLLNATFGNAIELIIATLALYAGLLEVVKASIVGSILGNILLVMGLSLFVGGVKHKEQKFNREAASTNATLLTLAVVAMVIPTTMVIAGNFSGENSGNVLQLSQYSSILLLLVYASFLFYQFKTHNHLYISGVHHDEEPSMSKNQAFGLLCLSTLIVAFMAEMLVGTIEHVASHSPISEIFIGIILIPLVGNAAEHSSAITVAYNNKMDLSLGIAVGSSTQIALFVAPLLVLLGWSIGQPLTLDFGLFATTITFLSILIVNSVSRDGRSDWLEGLMLLTTYAIVAIAYWGM